MSPQASPGSRTFLFGPILPDELIWSYLGRVIERYPSFDFGQIGSATPTYRKAFPTGLGRIAQAFDYPGAPSTTELIEGHTFFRFALPTITCAKARDLEESLAERTFPASAPHDLIHPRSFQLRLCPHCIAEDLARFGVAYWHRIHQVPWILFCPKHMAALHVSWVTAGERRLVTVTDGAKGSRAVTVGGMAAQRVVIEAYKTLARASTRVYREQFAAALKVRLEDLGFSARTQVVTALVDRVAAEFGLDTARELNLLEGHHGLGTWFSVPKLALISATLGMSFADLHARAAAEACLEDRVMTGHAAALEGRVRAMVPGIARRLKRGARRISPWMLANALSVHLGAGFATNHSWKPNIRAVLRAHAESKEDFRARVAT